MAEEIEDKVVSVAPVGYVVLAEGTIASDYALKNLNKALGEAQVEFLPSTRDETNAYAGYKYVPLEVIVASVRPSLTKNHLTVSQFSVTDLQRKTIAVYTRLVHWDSGEWMQNMMELPAEMALGKDGALKFNQQTIGGSQTYGQKYPYKAIVGIPDSEGDPDSEDENGDLQARPPKNKKQPTVCPVCGVAAIIKGKEEYGGGWLCYKAKGGCGAKFTEEPHVADEISHQNNAPKTTSTQQSVQRPPYPKEAQGALLGEDQPSCRFIPPNILTVIVKSIKEVAGIPAKPANGNIPAMRAVRPRLNITFLGQHNGVGEASCFDTGLWPAIKEAVGLECNFQIAEKDNAGRHFINIEDVLYIDGVPYVDGKPAVDTTTGEVIAERNAQ